jgi:hypothetical protein
MIDDGARAGEVIRQIRAIVKKSAQAWSEPSIE